MNNIVLALDKRMHPKEFIDRCIQYENKVHSVKINSLYHYLVSEHCDIFNDYLLETDLPLFADLKLFDIPTTVHDTILNLPKPIKYITVVFNGFNIDLLPAAAEAAAEKGIFIFFVWKLTSDLPAINTSELEADFGRWCYVLHFKLHNYKDNIGVVTPYYLLNKVREYSFTHTLTPGVYVDEPNEGQSATISINDIQNYQPDLIVLGRSFDKYMKKFK